MCNVTDNIFFYIVFFLFVESQGETVTSYRMDMMMRLKDSQFLLQSDASEENKWHLN
jgi:hypothetical protein